MIFCKMNKVILWICSKHGDIESSGSYLRKVTIVIHSELGNVAQETLIYYLINQAGLSATSQSSIEHNLFNKIQVIPYYGCINHCILFTHVTG